MSNSAIISYLGENKPNLISQITSYLTEIEGQFSGVTFATLGRVCELTMIYQKADKQNFDEIEKGLQNLESSKNGEFQIKPLETFQDDGPTSKISMPVFGHTYFQCYYIIEPSPVDVLFCSTR